MLIWQSLFLMQTNSHLSEGSDIFLADACWAEFHISFPEAFFGSFFFAAAPWFTLTQPNIHTCRRDLLAAESLL